MKAPNGQPTNLNEEQWVAVRTQRFKDWFGDWEKSTRIEKLKNSEPIINKYNGEYELNRESAKAWAKDNLRNTYTNKDTGEKISVSRLGINKSTSHSMGDEAHLKSFVDIPNFIENSIFITEQEAGKENAKYSKYRYYVAGVKIGGEDYTVKITIGVDSNGNKFYDHALTQFEKGKLIDQINNQPANGFISMGAEPNPSVAEHKDTKLVSILQNNSSKVVDENGEPMVVYHGTDAEFNVFDNKKGRENMDIQGMFFSPDKFDSQGYGSKVKSFFLNIRKPSPTTFMLNFQGQNKAGVKAYEYAIKQGYDGVMEEDDGYVSEYITFYPNQIKSATDNVGTYSEERDDIRYQIIGEQGARNLDNIEESTKRIENLAVAREMETAGKSTKEIRLATGWERGADGMTVKRLELYNIDNFEIDAEYKDS